MLPECCTIDDIYKQPADSDSTLTKRRSFGDQYMLFVRQNTTDYMENNFPPGLEVIRDMVIVQDERLPTLSHLLRRVDLSTLTTLYIVDCRLQIDDDDDLFASLSLRTLVLSHTHLCRLPRGLFDSPTLEVLKVDRNNLEEIPVELGNLSNLRTFCCDRQRPRLRTLPHTISRLDKLQVLSFSNNRIDNIAWVVTLPNLRVLRCDRNSIGRLPSQMVNLRELTTLDVSHNRLEYIPASFVDLLSRLYFFEYFNLTLRPKHVRRDRAQLLAHLEMEYFLSHSAGRKNVRDITVAVVGEMHSGKTTLVEALKDEKGLCKQDIRNQSTFEIHQFDMRSNESSCHVSTLVLANDILDNFTRNIHVDLYLLTVDLTSLELHNGSQHLFARHVSRLQMWLQALYEMAADTPVLLVGTHAELVKSMSFSDIWHILEGLLDQSRLHHIKRYADSRCQNCLLCCPKSLAVRHMVTKSRSGSAGFVDLSFPHCEPVMNGHVSSTDPAPSGKYRFPHVVGYYETDSRKHFPKDAKKVNMSIEQLKSAIIRLTQGSMNDGIPSNWLAFTRHVATIKEQAPGIPCIPYEEVVSIARSFDIAHTQVTLMLQYFHQRGNLVYFPNDDVLSRLVVINPTWFIQMISRTLDCFERSRNDAAHILQCLSDKELDRQLQKTAGATPPVSSANWMLAALQRLDLCLPIAETPTGDKIFVFPNLLETGSPSQDVWPDVPEWDEKQITCDFRIRAFKPSQFMEFIMRVNREGRRFLEIVPDPIPVLLSHHIVFFTGIDLGGCEDCCNIRRRLRTNRKYDDEFDLMDDVMHKVHIMLHNGMDAVRIQVRGVSPCCTMKAVLNFLELYLDDIPDEYGSESSGAASDRASLSSQAASAVSASCSSDSRGTGGGGSSSHGSAMDDDDERQFFLLCPKCVLLRHSKPERIVYQCMTAKRKAICSRWHNLGSWTRAVTGDYRCSNMDLHLQTSLTTLPEYEHPRLVMVLPPSVAVSNKEWYMFSRMKFLEGFEVHFLCENPAYWHMTENSGFRLHQSPRFIKKVGNQLVTILGLALPMVQVVQGVNEHGQTCRLIAPVVADLIKMYDYLRNVDAHIHDSYTWLTKNKDRVVTMLTKVLANASDGLPDLYFKAGSSINAEMIFQAPSRANRFELAKFLRIEASSGRFGPLRPLYVGREIRWVCDAHYEELRTMPSK